MSPEDGTRRLENLLKHSEYAEYQVLYTSDVQKRTKIWNDGTLRLFKINKKLILYDDDKILVYEDFWNRYERFKDQRTLKFEAVWITIDSLLGVYERDISGQFHQMNAHDVNTVAHMIKKPNYSSLNQIPRTPVSHKHLGYCRKRQTKGIRKHTQRIHPVGLRDSKGIFKSPLIGVHTQKSPFSMPLSPLYRPPKNNTNQISKGVSPHERTKRPNLHVDRTFETPILKIKQLLTPPLSNFSKDEIGSECDSTFSEIQTPLKNHDNGKMEFPDNFKELCRLGSEKVDVYDSDSQGNDELSEPDEEKHHEAKKTHSQSNIFKRLELGEKNADQIVTETWGHHDKISSQGTKMALIMSKRLLAKP
ncbi:DEBR0S1_32198g1_1 [Brettanomyces bruxellensis]|uniref:DEBR0S1_32198g1_1 n=1 Tax=Dekkera bruxellensis TaxID=5007 RepID=A0A7D9CVX2_DEKBR|nr:DEBR0S1_32198g1_1 [Brettanomyces bruxellensis]